MVQKRKLEANGPIGASKKKTKVVATDTSSSISALISGPLTATQRRALLRQLQTPSVISSLRRPEILMDFFTDCLSSPHDHSISVPAMTGLFHLIKTRNLDYPHFYTRLYALIDGSLFHGKYRSRFFRHLDAFLAPTNHLPAALVASFIKRLARLCLFAPPSAIVAVVPFVYNLLKQHPSTTFLIHRKPYPPYTKRKDRLGEDPYDPAEPNPHSTGAIDSSLWELETLQSHYHPTVSQIARIISEQFTKQHYNLEDFLDHGYATMMDSELKREVKKEPVVEWKIRKRIFFPELGEGQTNPDSQQEEQKDLLRQLWNFG
ncbi:hypothetical protein DV735_g4454, partial [Chaetothyriales sp. CBS 134920]